ncbi:hypothetical protein DV532_26380 (plasmid) [Pseudomonas sp. Leaf58]|uniref:hypothetical protein n=1 Tax=Pseudomonas sp. Leaf58 TaxID=1736226 RepID=UPI0006FE27FC|nr:hypothetical protein [Pseudomonas sp. Leaf58]AYG47813.1 hypothetical protein DV532_26380 [Pseudomonas sp. Leaf58]KQN62619.1 hypothetical protein ASF02_10760 [Pseudomonas sp. Leaf58]
MEQTPHSDIEKALRISGPEDFSYDGEGGVIYITGHYAEAIIDQMHGCLQYRDYFKGKEVRVRRGSGLEVWCDGVYVEAQPVRRILHAAARQIGRQYGFNLKTIAPATLFESNRWLTAA